MIRNHFTFYKNFYDSIQRLSKKDQAEIILAICAYALYEEEPDALSSAAYTAFSLMKPAIDNGRNRSRVGALGGSAQRSKGEANSKQNESKKEERRKKIEDDNIFTDIISKEEREEDIFLASQPTSDELYDKNTVKLTDAEVTDLIKNMGEDNFKHYAGVVAKCERSGRQYRKKHYDAIADMAKKDGKWGVKYIPAAPHRREAANSASSFETDGFWESALARTDDLLKQYMSEDE